MSSLSVDNLLGIKYLNKQDLNLIFKTSDNFKEVINRKIKKVPSLRDVTIANLFFENSTRTKLSFELAQKRLSADVVNFSSSGSSISKGETLIDTVNNILSMKVDMIVMRHPSPGASVFLSKNIKSCIINAGDGTHEHPTQALLDAYSLIEKIGDLKSKNILIVGDIMHSRVALSNIFAYQKLGANVINHLSYIIKFQNLNCEILKTPQLLWIFYIWGCVKIYCDYISILSFLSSIINCFEDWKCIPLIPQFIAP